MPRKYRLCASLLSTSPTLFYVYMIRIVKWKLTISMKLLLSLQKKNMSITTLSYAFPRALQALSSKTLSDIWVWLWSWAVRYRCFAMYTTVGSTTPGRVDVGIGEPTSRKWVAEIFGRWICFSYNMMKDRAKFKAAEVPSTLANILTPETSLSAKHFGHLKL